MHSGHVILSTNQRESLLFNTFLLHISFLLPNFAANKYKNSGTLRYGDDRDFDLVYWNVSGADIQLIRHNEKTQAFMDKAEELYKKQNAK